MSGDMPRATSRLGESTRDAEQSDVDPRHQQPVTNRPVEYATIGWENVADVLELGVDGSPEDGVTLVRVTLYRGKSATVRAKPGVAQGLQVLAHVLGPLYYVPPTGTRVLLAWPEESVGAPAVILGTVGKSPTQQFRQNRAVLDVGPGVDLVCKGKSVTLLDHGKSETPSRFACWLTVGPSAGGGAPGIYFSDDKGGGGSVSGGIAGMWATDAASPPNTVAMLQLAPDEASLSLKGQGFVKVAPDGSQIFHGTTVWCNGATVGLGKAPLLPVIGGLTAVAGVPSTNVLVST